MLYPHPKPEPKPKKERKPLKAGKGPPRDTERMAFVRKMSCTVCIVLGLTQKSPSQPDHIKSRGAGGKEAANLWPLCARHHDERHRLGLRAFAYRYGVVPNAKALAIEAKYRHHIGAL